MGRREDKKAETARRIALAGRVLFRRQGYDQTTTQEIAIEAGIPPGTLFGYISTKADILLMALLGEAVEFVATLPDRVPAQASLLDQVTFIFNEMQAYHSSDPELFRHFMRELTIDRSKELSPNTSGLGNALRATVAAVVARRQAAGELVESVSASKISMLLFAHYWQCLAFWAIGVLTEERFRTDLREALSWQICAFYPRAGPPPHLAEKTAKPARAKP